jgi:Tol biopolymer transport system component
LSSNALSRDDLMTIADRVIRRGHQLRRRRTALRFSALAAVVGVVAATLLSFGTSESSLRTVDRPDVGQVDRPDVGQVVPTPTTVPVAGGAPAVDPVPVPGTPSLDLPLGQAPTTTAPSGVPSVSPLTGRIAFVRERDGSHDQAIYVMNADGSGERRLSNSVFNDVSPAWSPDGTRIAFASYREGTGGAQIYVMNADGTAQQRLTFVAGDAGWPAWSPDGARIAYSVTESPAGVTCSTPGFQPPRTWVMNADGSNAQPVTGPNDPAKTCGQLFPAWSPDGTRLAYEDMTTGAGGPHIATIDLATGQTRLEVPGHQPAWSPDGRSIAYYAVDSPALRVLEVGSTGGRDVVRVDETVMFMVRPAWSPDGQHILFARFECTDGLCGFPMPPPSRGKTIWSVRIDGTSLTQLTSGNWNDSYPSITR